jgi:hypothetical protein
VDSLRTPLPQASHSDDQTGVHEPGFGSESIKRLRSAMGSRVSYSLSSSADTSKAPPSFANIFLKEIVSKFYVRSRRSNRLISPGAISIFASNNREAGTPNENKAIVQGGVLFTSAHTR